MTPVGCPLQRLPVQLRVRDRGLLDLTHLNAQVRLNSLPPQIMNTAHKIVRIGIHSVSLRQVSVLRGPDGTKMSGLPTSPLFRHFVKAGKSDTNVSTAAPTKNTTHFLVH